MLDLVTTFGLGEDPLRHYFGLRLGMPSVQGSSLLTMPSATDTQDADKKGLDEVEEAPPCEDQKSEINHTSTQPRKRKFEVIDTDLETRRRLWRQQVPHLYDLVVNHRRSPGAQALQWPAGAARLSGDVVLQRMVFGTREALVIAAVQVPWKEPMAEEYNAFQSQSQDEGQLAKPSVRVTQYMKHEGPVKHLTCSPQTYLLTATQAEGAGDVRLFRVGDWQTAANPECRADRLLEVPGSPCGCCWMGGGNLLSGCSTGAHLWDVEAGSIVKECSSGDFKTTAVEANSKSPELFATSGSDGRCRMWDTRTGGVIFCWDCHQGPSSSVAFSGDRVASGGADSGILLWELRQPKQALCSCSWDGHFGAVSHLAWAPDSNRQLAAAYADGRILLWDVEKAKSEPGVAEEPPGLMFVHGGHSGCEPTGVAWSHDCPQLMASATLQEIQFWRPAAMLFGH